MTAEQLERLRDELRGEVTSEMLRKRMVASTNGHANLPLSDPNWWKWLK